MRLATLLLLLICDLEGFAALRPETKNKINFDRIQCWPLKPEMVHSYRCGAKRISNRNMKFDYEVHMKQPIFPMVHCVVNYKFNGIVYNKFPIDLWENPCEFLDGKREKTFFLDWTFGKMQRYSNANHSCPYKDFIMKVNNVSIDDVFSFDQSILPSGQYRIDITFTNENRVPLGMMYMYGSIDEHHLEKV